MKAIPALFLNMLLILFICSVASAQDGEEKITLVTYYPAPGDAFDVLYVNSLLFDLDEDGTGLIGFFDSDNNFDQRLRLTAGGADTGDNDEGSSIDLHGNDHATRAGDLDLVAGRGDGTAVGAGTIRFFTGATGALEAMRITHDGRVALGVDDPGADLMRIRGKLGLGFPDEGAGPTVDGAPGALTMYANGSDWFHMYNANDGTLRISTGHSPNDTMWPPPAGVLPSRDILSITGNGNVGIGTTTPNSSAALDLGIYTSPTVPRVFLPPRMDTSQRNIISNPPKGSVVYNTSTDQLEVNAGTAAIPNWQSAAGSGGPTTRRLRGIVDSKGDVLEGSGFTSTRTATGRFTITFNTPFAKTPLISANSYEGPAYSYGGYYIRVYDMSNTGFKVRTWNHNNSYLNCHFSFIVIQAE